MIRRMRMVVLPVVAALAAALALAAPARAADPCNFDPLVNETYCELPTYGYSSSGSYGQTGRAFLSAMWSADGRSLKNSSGESDIGVQDTWANGRGVMVQINAHKYGTPVDNNSSHYISIGYFKDNYGLPVSFSAYWAYGIDFLYVNYADSYSGCSYCYVGTYRVNNPMRMPIN